MENRQPLNEDALIRRLTRHLRLSSRVRVGVGDDCAVLRHTRNTSLLFKTDAVVSGRHFLLSAPAWKVGWKVLCRNISDVAAMGGRPTVAVVSLLVPQTLSSAYLKGLYKGLEKAARRFSVCIAGGDTSSADNLAVVVALLGEVENRRLVLRSGALAGDRIFVTGRVGGSLGGKHLTFTPRVAEAEWLTAHYKPSAMMDLSDGLAADLPRLAKASGLSYRIAFENIPVTPGCSLREALAEGEDYELLLTMPKKKASNLRASWEKVFPRLPLTDIGEMVSPQVKPTPLPHGFDHFRDKFGR